MRKFRFLFLLLFFCLGSTAILLVVVLVLAIANTNRENRYMAQVLQTKGAALIQAVDIVITISNSTAHLAGALGKPTLLLLPSGKGQLWYWTEVDSHIPWYPFPLH